MRITVLLGGVSAERDVSLSSGVRIAAALRTRGHEVTCLDPAHGVLPMAREDELRSGGVGVAPPSLEQLAALRRASLSPELAGMPALREADCVFLALHGGQGEDGTVQALLELVGVPYTGSGPLGSAIAMDKELSKILFRAAGVQTADWLMARADGGTTAAEVARAVGWPAIVKPSKQGSTVGLSVVRSGDELPAAVAEAFRYDDEVMIERFVPGRELTVGIVGGEALPVVEIIPKKGLYDYEAKYTPGMTEEYPVDLGPALTTRLSSQAVAAFRALKLSGYARADFRLDPQGEPWCLEVNTLPGMTPTSLLPIAAKAAGMDFADLCERIVGLATGRTSAR
ncbi:MAG: D-alanine--D-alanine ligase [Gemmatimonadaceae bacterium]|jgi:D-alanine-D-alanine ligase|nr:D-alanine--D-alanine ligase [Gemmatimonadaceae bacterium]